MTDDLKARWEELAVRLRKERDAARAEIVVLRGALDVCIKELDMLAARKDSDG